MYHEIIKLYQGYYPFSDRECKRKAAWLSGCIAVIGLSGVLILSLFGSGYFFYLLSGFFLYLVYSECCSFVKSLERKRLRNEFCHVLSNVRHQYYRCPNVAEAVYYAAEGLEGESQRHLELLRAVLCSEDKKSEMERYKNKVADRFYRMFLLQTVSVEEHGDEAAEGSSVFLWSLGYLRREAELELRNAKRLEYLLSGLGLVIGTPIFAMPAIKNWAVGNLPELDKFYNGFLGRWMELLFFILAVAGYCFLQELKGKKYTPPLMRILVCGKKVKAVRKFAKSYAKRFGAKGQERLLRRTGDIRSLEEFFLYRVASAFVFPLLFATAYFLLRPLGGGRTVFWAFLSALAPILGYWYPWIRLQTTKGMLADRMQEEVLNFQFIVRMEAKLPGITTLELLEELFDNSAIFRDSLRCCIRNYAKEEREAFLALWQQEDYPPFRRLIDMFLMVDESGISEAFDEIAGDMEGFQENRKLEMEILQKRRAEAAMLLACIPGICILFGYLIIPFMLECFRMLGNYNGGMTGL